MTYLDGLRFAYLLAEEALDHAEHAVGAGYTYDQIYVIVHKIEDEIRKAKKNEGLRDQGRQDSATEAGAV